MNDNKPVDIHIVGESGAVWPRVIVSGVPLPEGFLRNLRDASIFTTRDHEELSFSLEALSRWPDGSVRWCLIKALLRSDDEQISLRSDYENGESIESKKQSNFHCDLQADSITISDGDLDYFFDNASLFPGIKSPSSSEADITASLLMTDERGGMLSSDFDAPTLIKMDDLSAQIEYSGTIEMPDRRQLKLALHYEIRAGQEMLLTVEVHNPDRARHRNGIWDLGDEGSQLFKSMNLRFSVPGEAEIKLRTDDEQDWKLLSTGFNLYQASSGGEHWDCPTHVNRNNKCTNEFCGFRLSLPNEIEQVGKRASPFLQLASQSIKLAIQPLEFWQNFPKKLSHDKGRLDIGLFPDIEHDCHELQGGERKRHRIRICVGKNQGDVESRMACSPFNVSMRVERTLYENVLGSPVGDGSGDYEKLLVSSLDDSTGFLAKREKQDEFGWRHFGEVVADHETLYHPDDSYFISHYNNQYDCIFGFARQYVLSGDMRWYRLMDELARHVLDIDIYRTEQDRAEYNYGLFWHTDHYKNASTATHRTYSKDHYPDGWDGPKGGGPGPEHCYTSGLKIYHCLTGSEDAKDAVIRLTEWISNYYEGSGTFIEFGKKIATHDLRKFISTVKGNRTFKYRYPFNRGVGNYVRALIDSFELTGDESYLTRASRVVNNTFGPADDIDLRNLDDIENTWYYTIFLQEVIRYLDTKRACNQFDADFYRACAGLQHYARWMMNHERPYLEQSAKLEYPNDTWIAQDIRKANVLYGAYRYARSEREQLLDRARYFRDYVIESMSDSDTLHFARIQALLLQNHGPAQAMNKESRPYHYPSGQTREYNEDSLYKVTDFYKAVVAGLLRAMKTSNPMMEYTWLRSRLVR